MKLTFEHIHIENFKSFYGDHQIDLSSYPKGLCFVKGTNEQKPRLDSNGAGKSSIWDALSWCLYGKTPDNLRNPDIRPWHVSTKEKTSVEVGITIDDDHYLIERTTSPNSFKINGESANPKGIDKLIRMSFEVFTHTVLFAQEFKLFYDLTSSGKMELFSEILNLDRWEERSKKASDKVKELSAQKLDQDLKLSEQEGRSSQISEFVKKAKKDADEFDANRESRLETIKKDLDDKNVRLKKAEDNLANHQVNQDKHAVAIKSDEKTLSEHEEKLKDLNDKIFAAQSSLKMRDGDIKRKTKEISDISGGDTCPTCGQSIKGTDLWEHREALADEVEAERETWKKVNRRLEKLLNKKEMLDTHVTELKDSIKKKRAFSDEDQSAISTTQQTVSDLKSDIRNLTTRREELETEANPYAESYRSNKKELSKIRSNIRELKESLDKLDSRIERTKYWVKGFKEIRLYVIEDVIEKLESMTNDLLSSFELGDHSIIYDVEKETKSGSIKRGLQVFIQPPDYDHPIKWESWSGGERQRLRLIGSLALSEVLLSYIGVYPSMEILDEPSCHMNAPGVRDLCNYLSDRARDIDRQIWFTDHLAVESARFSGSLMIGKGPKGSYVVS